MQHLRIMGVREAEGQDDLILADESGTAFTLPVDEALRSAVNRAAHRPARGQGDGTRSTGPLSPRDIQAWLRAGATVEQVVSDSGLDAAHVERYAGPVQAERAYIAQRARSAEIAPASPAEQHRVAFGDAAATLEAMVTLRLRAAGVDLRSISWDAWRREDGRWKILCWFDAHGATGEAPTPPAEWIFTPESRHLLADGPAAEELSSLPTAARPGRSRRLAPVDAPYDVESEEQAERAPVRPAAEPTPSETPTPAASAAAPSQPGPGRSTTDEGAADRSPARPGVPSGPTGGQEGDEQEALLEMLRRRRGQRLGADEEADDKLAMMLTREERPAARPSPGVGEEPNASAAPVTPLRPVEDAGPHADAGDATDDVGRAGDAGDAAEDAAPEEHVTEPIARPASPGRDPEDPEDQHTDAWGFRYEEAGEDSGEEPDGAADSPDAASPAAGSPDAGSRDADPARVDETAPRSADAPSSTASDAARPKKGQRRPNMPRWDDILFGGRED